MYSVVQSNVGLLSPIVVSKARQGVLHVTDAKADSEVQSALHRFSPEVPIHNSDELNYNAPLVAYLGNPIKPLAIDSAIGGGIGLTLGAGLLAITKDGGIFHQKLLVAGALGVIGAGIGALCSLRAISNQKWVNKNIVEMIELTKPTETLGEANKVLKTATGDSFTHRLSRRENRQKQDDIQSSINNLY